MTNIWVLIPAHRPALGQLRDCMRVLGELASHVVVVTNGEHPLTEHETHTHVIDDRGDINISRWWNKGLDWIAEHDETIHHVLVLNADARIQPASVARLSLALERNPEVVQAGPMPFLGTEIRTVAGPVDPPLRIPGYCFMLTSRNPIRADEQFRWWCGDDDLEWRAREAGGALRLGRIPFDHLGDGMPRGDLMELAKADLLRFEEKWGIRPW